MKEETNYKTMTTLPQELIAKILFLLPVKPLVRFQCVSQPWFALINDSYFIKMHLNRSIETNRELTLILERMYTGLPPSEDYLVNLCDKDRFGKAVEIKHPLHHPNKRTEIVDSSCDGLVCVRNWEDEIVIWNPLIKTYKKIPFKPVENSYSFELAFGYDRVNDDYKVLRIVKSKVDEVEVEVYSLRGHKWKRVEEEWPFKESIIFLGPAFLNGAIHWVVAPIDFKMTTPTILIKFLVAFDLSTEKFRVYAIPVKFFREGGVTMVVLRGRLCVCAGNDVWMMKEYGVESSWALLFTVKPASSFYQPLVFSHDGEEVLIREITKKELKKFFWYDIKRRTRRIVKIQNVPADLFQPITCVGSLLLLDADGR